MIAPGGIAKATSGEIGRGTQAFQDSAAPHLPAGILSPYSDGERGAAIAGFANRQHCKMSAEVAAGVQPIDG
ncbi:hypothetical protein EH240_08470 [Mesorhizobium tamadayense]|uniref:Uncharacterized protein n=1 Tax=Mesorhizobium tamadayense TaxID=425306 RepID=A0A3P3G0Y2_9HYPH|nr:hypothetical protein EH240_08470 [Mesorhizobium tamadayense]